MRELHAWHGEHRRQVHDAAAATDTPGKHGRGHDATNHEARDALKLKMLLDPEARKAERLKYQQKVEAAEAEYTARHAKPQDGGHARAPEQLKPQETATERKDAQSQST